MSGIQNLHFRYRLALYWHIGCCKPREIWTESIQNEVTTMNILSGFFGEDLAIDLGTVNTIVYTPTEGVVLNEPSVIALNKYSGEVLSVGSQALNRLGLKPNDPEVSHPILRCSI